MPPPPLAAVALPPLKTVVPVPAAQLAQPPSTPLGSAADIPVGLARSVAGTLAGVQPLLPGTSVWQATPADLAAMTPLERQYAATVDPANLQRQMEQAALPQNTVQNVAKTVGDYGQFFLPGEAEEALAARAAPYVGRALPALKMGLAALGSAAVNRAEGGGTGAGAAWGAGGSALGQGLKAAVPGRKWASLLAELL